MPFTCATDGKCSDFVAIPLPSRRIVRILLQCNPLTSYVPDLQRDVRVRRPAPIFKSSDFVAMPGFWDGFMARSASAKFGFCCHTPSFALSVAIINRMPASCRGGII